MTEEYKLRKKAYVDEYQRKFYTTFSFKLRTVEDAKMIQFLNSIPNKSEFFKKLIDAEMHGK